MSRAVANTTQPTAGDATATPALAVTPEVKSAGPLFGAITALFPPRVVLFVALFAWILYAWVDMRLVFQCRESLFFLNFNYLDKFLARPGALMEWTDRLLVQLCYWDWPGAIAVAAAAWLLLVATIGLMNATGRAAVGRGTQYSGSWVVPAILLVALFGQYQFRASTVVALALAMTAANGYARIPVHRASLRLVLFLIVSLLLYYVIGPAYYVFAACCVIYEALSAKRWFLGVCCLLAAIGVKLGLDAVLFRINLANCYVALPPLMGYDERFFLNWGVVLLYAYFPVCAVLVVYLPVRITLRRDALSPRRSVMRTAVRWIAGTALLLTAAALTGWYSIDRILQAVLEIDYCAEHQQWSDVLAKAGALPLRLYSPSVNHDVDLALYHTGRLPYDMFAYPQVSPPMLTYQSATRPGLMRKPFDLLMEMGRVNEAEHVALEMLEVSPCGGTLKRLALVKLTKGQTAAACVVLQVLCDDLVWGRWADGYLRRVAADPTLADDEEIRQTRRLMIVEDDRPMTGKPGPGNVYAPLPAGLEKSLEPNAGSQRPLNRMALEYLLAIRLLERDVHGVATVLSHLDKAVYPTLPPLYEEALLIDGVSHPDELVASGDGVFFHGRKISEATLSKFHRFQQNHEAGSAIADEFGSSYLGYYFHVVKERS